jgi:acetyl-CoA carboxylase biotin carboxylase subunit
MKKINKILIANRGEIAIRVMRSAREMGIQTVAVYSEADRGALHVQMADEAYPIGPAPASRSYLDGEKVIKVAKESGADAIHPGYGFLSENAAFADQVTKAGLIFIGPPSNAIEVMGDKLAAKKAVMGHNIPMVPGTDSAINDIEKAEKEARNIGYPILIKAAAGGGGKGMRIVEDPGDFRSQMNRAVSEAESAFGDGSVFIEKFIQKPRHIEIQIMGDQHGNILYLFERECSVQRRHQKVVEEAPSPVVSPEMRAKMGNCAVEVARACGYYGAGTVEFIVDENLDFYFLEMNTRLQVEHPVTELITGLDLVKQQIRVAQGEKLSINQEDLGIHGHSIESRVYAEDPNNNFLPDIGRLTTYIRPQGAGVRVDDGYEEGMEIPIHYDPMISKLITYGETREEAIQRMIRAIDEYHITGVATTLPFCKFVMQHEDFTSGDFNTKFVEKNFTGIASNTDPDEEMVAIAAAAYHYQKSRSRIQFSENNVSKKWKKRLRN